MEMTGSIFDQIEKVDDFARQFLRPVKWFYKLERWSAKDFSRSYLIPKIMVNWKDSRIPLLYTFVIAIEGRKYKKKSKRIVYNRKKAEFVTDLLYLSYVAIQMIRFKTEGFEMIKKTGAVGNLNEYTYFALGATVNAYFEKGKDFDDFKKSMNDFLVTWKIELVPDDEIEDVRLDIEEGDAG